MGYVLCSTVMDLSLCIAFCIVLYCTLLYFTVTYSTVLYLHSITSIVLLLYCPGLARTSVSPDPALICHSLTLRHSNVLYFIVQCCIVLYLIVLYCIVLYSNVLYSAVLYCGPEPALICHSLTLWALMPSRSQDWVDVTPIVAVCSELFGMFLFCTVLYCIVLYCIVLYRIVLYRTVLYSTVLCFTVLY